MRCAVPISNGILSPHFGHCEQFALFDIDEQNKRIIEKKLLTSPQHEPGLLPAWLARQGVVLVIAGGIGMRAQNLFQQSRISVITGALERDPEQAVLSYLNGTLSTGANVCDH